MVLLGQLLAFTPCSEQHQERNRAVFYHEGNKISKNTFLSLHNIGNFHLKALKEHLYSNGLVPRIHSHSSRTSPNALVLEDVRSITAFILEYTEALEFYYLGEFLGTKGMISIAFIKYNKTCCLGNVSKQLNCHVYQSCLVSDILQSVEEICKPHICIKAHDRPLCCVPKNSVTILWSVNLNEDQQQRYTNNNAH